MARERIQRVPPPPPPGFGDEEYYQLYGRPEEYQRYRQQLEDLRYGRRPSPPPRHREYPQGPPPSRYHREGPSASPGGYYDRSGYHYDRYAHNTASPPFDKDDDFQNFRVTIQNKADRARKRRNGKHHAVVESPPRRRSPSRTDDGTPSLSGIEDDNESEESDYDENSYDDESAGSGEYSEGSESSYSSPKSRQPVRSTVVRSRSRPSERKEKRGADNAGNKKRPVKDRLGRRPASSSRNDGPSSSRSRKDNRSPPVKRQKSRRSMTITPEPLPPRKRTPQPSPRSSRSRTKDRQRPRSPRTPPSGRGRNAGSRGLGSSRSERGQKAEKVLQQRKLRMDEEERKKDGSPSRNNRRKRNKSRERLRKKAQKKRAKLRKLGKQLDYKGENEEMMKKLRQKSRGKPKTSESDKNLSLAKLAGLEIPPDTAGLHSEVEEGNERGSQSRSRSKSAVRSWKKNERNKGDGRSSSNESPPKKKKGKSPNRWKHDKFPDTLASPIIDRERDDRDFGEHWQRIRSEKSKERERNRSRSGSRRRGRRSYSSNSSRSRSRKRNRSSSSFSRSRSRSFRRSSSSSSSGSVHRERRSYRRSKRRDAITQAATMASKALQQRGKELEGQQNQPLDDVENEGVNLQLSGKLMEDTNMVNGVIVKYGEPKEARKPKTKWRLYVFKGNEELPILYIHRQSAYLLGRDRKVADIPLDHPSCSKQHAALQYRLMDYVRKDGSNGRRVVPYVIDLNSANGTFVNNQKIESQKYVQLMEKDVLKFGFSSREYVMLHDQSKDSEEDDPGLE